MIIMKFYLYCKCIQIEYYYLEQDQVFPNKLYPYVCMCVYVHALTFSYKRISGSVDGAFTIR